MDRNQYRGESVSGSEASSPVSTWAKAWAESFRRDAWKQKPIEVLLEEAEPEEPIESELPPAPARGNLAA